MKLSEMTTATAFDTMEKLLPIVSDIVSDDEVKKVKDSLKKTDDKIVAGTSFGPIMALFLGKRRESMFELAAIASGESVDKVKKQPLAVTMQILQQTIDGEMMSFFALCLRMVMTA